MICLTVFWYDLSQALLFLSNKYNTTSISNRQVIEGLAYLNYDNIKLYNKESYPEKTDESGRNSMFTEEFRALLSDGYLSVKNDRVEILKPEGLNEIVTMAEYLQRARSAYINN